MVVWLSASYAGELLPVACDARLARVDGTLDGRDHVQELCIVLGVADIVEPGVLKGLLASHAFRRIHFQQSTHEAECLLRQTTQVAFLQRLRLGNVRELEAVEARVLAEALLLIVRERSEHLLNKIQLVHFRVSREQRLPVTELSHDAADGPHVNFGAILGITQQQLRGSIPASRYVISHLAAFELGPIEGLR